MGWNVAQEDALFGHDRTCFCHSDIRSRIPRGAGWPFVVGGLPLDSPHRSSCRSEPKRHSHGIIAVKLPYRAVIAAHISYKLLILLASPTGFEPVLSP